MSVQVMWLVEQQVILCACRGQLTYPDLEQMVAQIADLSRSSSAPLVHVVIEASDLDFLPSVREISALRGTTPAGGGWTLLVGVDNHLLRFLASMIVQMFAARFRFVNTLDAALQFLQEMDSTLPDLQAALRALGAGSGA